MEFRLSTLVKLSAIAIIISCFYQNIFLFGIGWYMTIVIGLLSLIYKNRDKSLRKIVQRFVLIVGLFVCLMLAINDAPTEFKLSSYIIVGFWILYESGRSK